MPHIIVEYSQNIEGRVSIPDMLTQMHDALSGQGVDKGRIKTRGTALNHSIVGNAAANEGQMVHITLLLLEGRDTGTKKQYSEPLHGIACKIAQGAFPDCTVTLEVRDMSAATYIL